MPLTPKQVKDVCMLGGGHQQCRYLANDPGSWNSHHCCKLTPYRKIVDAKVSEALKQFHAAGQDYKKQGVAVTDNCPGYPLLKLIDQGYDVKSP